MSNSHFYLLLSVIAATGAMAGPPNGSTARLGVLAVFFGVLAILFRVLT